MPSYYNLVEGNLKTGEIAKSSDINHIQLHIRDALKELLSDLHREDDEGASYILGSGEAHKNDFIITPAPKTSGRYIDDEIWTTSDVNESNYININRNDVKQPILLTKHSVYSVVIKMKNDSNKDIPVQFELQDLNGEPIRTNTITIPKETKTPKDFEVVFDLDYYPTILNLNHEDLIKRDGKDIPHNKPTEEGYDEGFTHNKEEENQPLQFSMGVSQLFLVIKRTNLNETDLAEMNGDQVTFNPDTSLGVFYTTSSPHPDKEIYCYVNGGTIYEQTGYNIYFREIYANEDTYICTGGEAIIDGEKVKCIDTHVSVAGGNSYGNMLTSVYLGPDGHIHSRNSQANLTKDINSFEEDLDDRMPVAGLPIALILTYSNIYGIDKEPLIIQNQESGLLPLSHHERIRRLEKQMDWSNDIAIPSRLKYTLTGESWIDDNPGLLSDYPNAKGTNKEDISSYYITTDTEGNPVVRLSSSKITTIPITLKETFKDKDGNNIIVNENDILRASQFAEKKNVVHDSSAGTIILATEKKEKKTSPVALKAKEAKETEFNPWDDYKGNRPASSKLSKHERKFTVIKGKNGKHDFNSQYPAMTFYAKSNYKLTKLNIPLYKFENCSGIQFFIWKRQESNNKKNTVWLEKSVYTSKVFSLKKAKVKGKYQYMEDGFTINFGKGGLSLPKGQYVFICLPIPKSGEGSCFVETYEPQNPKDFLIRYYGAANASHFLLKTRYPEIWYNSAKATVIEDEYYRKGTVISKTITWTEDGLEKIEKIKPIIKDTLSVPKSCSYKIFADTGGGWIELTPDQENTITGGATTFRWKLELYGSKDNTPKLQYKKAKGYALEFILTRAKSGSSNLAAINDKDKNMCLTTVPLNGDEILRDYVGDPNLGTIHSKFNQHEFARVWADPKTNDKLLIDIQGSDKDIKSSVTSNKYPLWTMHYCDLTLDDFSQTSVDYSHYNEEVEYDENNLRLKLDSEHSYNDDDIVIASLQNFKKVENSLDTTTDKKMIFTNNSEIKKNQILLKNTFENPYDFTKFTGIRAKFKVYGNNATELKGLGLYISASEVSEVTTLDILTDTSNEINILSDTEVLPPTIDPDVSSANYYDGNIIKLIHYVDADNDGNKAYEDAYYQYVQEYDPEQDKMIYVLQQLHDFKNYKLYKIGDIKYDEAQAFTETIPATEEGEPDTTIKYTEFSVRVEIDPDSQILKYAKEIGFVTLVDDQNNPYSVTTSSENQGSITLDFIELRGLSEDYYPIFTPGKDVNLLKKTSNANIQNSVEVYHYNEIYKDGTKYKSNTTATELKDLSDAKKGYLKPYVEQIAIKYTDIPGTGENQVAYINNPYEGGLSHYKHLGIQIASDVYIPKDCIKIQLCEKENGVSPFVSVNLPTLNTIYEPKSSENINYSINLSQIFKKINSDKEIKSINFVVTDYFAKFMSETISSQKGNWMSLFIGKIVLYKAETIPMFHNTMRLKLYSATNGEIDHQEQDITNESINIRKIGTVVDYS